MKFLAAARRSALTTVTVISFSLTFVLAGLALLLLLLPEPARAIGSVDLGVVLLLVPLLALVAAMLVQATRLALRGPLLMRDAKRIGQLTEWKPGHGEG